MQNFLPLSKISLSLKEHNVNSDFILMLKDLNHISFIKTRKTEWEENSISTVFTAQEKLFIQWESKECKKISTLTTNKQNTLKRSDRCKQRNMNIRNDIIGLDAPLAVAHWCFLCLHCKQNASLYCSWLIT